MVSPCPIYWLRNDWSMNLRAGEWKCGWASSCRQHTSLSSASHNSESNSRTKPVKTHSVPLSSKVFVNEPRANNTDIIKTTSYVRPPPYTVIMLQKPVEVLIPPIMYIVQIDIQIPSKLGLVSLKHSCDKFLIFVAMNKAPVANIKPFCKSGLVWALVKKRVTKVIAVSY